MKWTKKQLILLAAVVACIALGALAGFLIFHKSPAPQQSNVYTITDSSIGLSFSISKDFTAIPRDELTSMNPAFLYGFQPADDANAQCIVSQTILTAPVVVSNGSLNYMRQGTFDEVKKAHPTAKLDSWAVVSVGSTKGALLQINYTDGPAKIERVELVVPGKTALTFAYCQSLAADNAKYHDDFTVFFSSLKLTS